MKNPLIRVILQRWSVNKNLKGAISGLRQFSAVESHLNENDEKCFLFPVKSSFHSQDIYVFVFTFWSYVAKLFDEKDTVDFKFYVTTCLTNNCNTHIA